MQECSAIAIQSLQDVGMKMNIGDWLFTDN